jgi:hypothetical protein
MFPIINGVCYVFQLDDNIIVKAVDIYILVICPATLLNFLKVYNHFSLDSWTLQVSTHLQGTS